VITFFEFTWYSGSVYGGIDAAQRYNRRRLDSAVNSVNGDAGFEPDYWQFAGVGSEICFLTRLELATFNPSCPAALPPFGVENPSSPVYVHPCATDGGCLCRVSHGDMRRVCGESGTGQQPAVGETSTTTSTGLHPRGHSEMTSSWVEEDGKRLIQLRFTAKATGLSRKSIP